MKPVATGLGLVFAFSSNSCNHNRTDHQRARTATAVWSFFGPVWFSLRSFCGPRTRLLNTNSWTSCLSKFLIGIVPKMSTKGIFSFKLFCSNDLCAILFRHSSDQGRFSSQHLLAGSFGLPDVLPS